MLTSNASRWAEWRRELAKSSQWWTRRIDNAELDLQPEGTTEPQWARDEEHLLQEVIGKASAEA